MASDPGYTGRDPGQAECASRRGRQPTRRWPRLPRKKTPASRPRQRQKPNRPGQGSGPAREAETNAVLDFVDNRILAAARPEGQAGGLGKDVTLREAIEVAIANVNTSFTNQPLIEARLRMTLGTSFSVSG